MLLFLQNFRYTLIPTIVVPVCLLGTLAVMLPLGFSVNMMTMFGMVLAIGILVDDAIVVVENVERLMAQEGLSPREATVKAMKQISGAIVGITPRSGGSVPAVGFMSGSVGVIYRQFSVSLAISILFSGFPALTMTPALCATLLAYSKGSPCRAQRLVRLVQSTLRSAHEWLLGDEHSADRERWSHDAGIRRDRGGTGLHLYAPAVGVPAYRRPRLCND